MLREAADFAVDFIALCLLMATVAAVVVGIAAMMGPLP
jgi:hypothetical protein